jgi:hypothetical protein
MNGPTQSSNKRKIGNNKRKSVSPAAGPSIKQGPLKGLGSLLQQL